MRITILEWVSCFVPGAGSTCDEVPEDASAFLSKLDVESGQRILPDFFVTVQAFPGDVLDKKRWGWIVHAPFYAHYPLNLSAAWTQIFMLFSSCVFLDVSLGLRVSCFLKCRSTGALGFLTCQVRHDRRSKSATSRRARVWPRFHWDTFWERFKALGLGHWIRCLQIPVLLHCFLAFCWRHSTDKKESWLQPGLLSWQDKAKLSRNSTSNDWLVIVFFFKFAIDKHGSMYGKFSIAAMENFVQKRLRTYWSHCSQSRSHWSHWSHWSLAMLQCRKAWFRLRKAWFWPRKGAVPPMEWRASNAFP